MDRHRAWRWLLTVGLALTVLASAARPAPATAAIASPHGTISAPDDRPTPPADRRIADAPLERLVALGDELRGGGADTWHAAFAAPMVQRAVAWCGLSIVPRCPSECSRRDMHTSGRHPPL